MADDKKFARPTGDEKDFKHLVRVLNTDLDGKKPILYALTKIKGIKYMLSNAICRKANLPLTKRAGFLSDDEIKSLETVLSDLNKAGIPPWMMNRRKDVDTGEDKHLITNTLDYTQEMDIKKMKKTKSYKGLRHQWGQPVRGQRTKSNFRKNKGKGSLGVQKKKIKSGKV
jgi:small subunit ribosomal protein S13